MANELPPEFENGEWDEEFELTVRIRVKAKPNPDIYERSYGRKPIDYAMTALNCAGLRDAERLDGYADLIGEAYIVDVEKAW